MLFVVEPSVWVVRGRAHICAVNAYSVLVNSVQWPREDRYIEWATNDGIHDGSVSYA